jgi:hypothetical protein
LQRKNCSKDKKGLFLLGYHILIALGIDLENSKTSGKNKVLSENLEVDI